MHRPDARGFTMLEITMVAVVLAIVAILAVPRFAVTAQRSRQTEADANLQVIRNAQMRYFQDQSTYTTDTSKLGLDVWPSGWYRYCILSADATNFEAVATPNSGTNPSVGIRKNGSTYTPTSTCP